jgi:putative acetyltransferase
MVSTVIEIRNETPDDHSAVREVNERAFGRPNEATLVDMLRSANKALISLVALDQGRVVGHILFSTVSVVVAPENFRGVGLGPMSVLPEFQNMGIGSSLVREGLEACKREKYGAVVVLGHTKFYPRFGFSKAKDYGLDNEYDATDAFMVMELEGGVLEGVSGLVKYASEFRDVGC